METQIKQRLSDAAIDGICGAMLRGDFTDGMVLLYKEFGIDLRDPDGPQISPSDYAIPEDQWGTLCNAAMNVAADRGPIAKVNMALDFMNIGPSGYGEDEA